jgi:hypothetical protein
MIAPLSLPDAFQMGTLHVPRRSTTPFLPAQPPVEMATPSISFGNAAKRCMAPPLAAQQACETAVWAFSGSLVPALYLHYALVLALGSLLFPDYLVNWALVIAPLLISALSLHALSGGIPRLVYGLFMCLAYPVVILSRGDRPLQAVYVVLVGAFASGPFWREERGAWLVACCAAWVALPAAAAWLLSGPENPRGPLAACVGAALALALVGSRRLGRLQYKVVQGRNTTNEPA